MGREILLLTDDRERNFPDKNYLDVLCSVGGGDGSILSWRMAKLVARNVGVVRAKNS